MNRVKKFNVALLVMAWLAILPLAPVVLFTPGCTMFGDVDPGASALVVNAERLAKLSFVTMDGFLEWELANRTRLPADVTRVADAIRDTFPKGYTAFRNATKAYKNNRTADNKATLETAMAVIQSALDTAMTYLPAAEKARAQARAEALGTIP